MKEEREKILVLVRGIPGAGKTTFAEKLAWPLGAPVYSADDYFMKDGKYIFNVAGLGAAHAQCLERTKGAMEISLGWIFVANTFTTEKEMKPYFDLAQAFGYKVFSIIVENRHGNSSVHNVPEENIKRMIERFNIKL